MRRFAQFLLMGSFLAIPGIAQRGGGGFHGGGGGFHGGMGGFHGGAFVGPGFRGGGFRGFHGGFFPGNRFVFGFPGYWPYYGAGWGSPYYYGYPYDPYPYAYPYVYSYPSYGYGDAYNATDQTSCPQANGKPLYQIKLTYVNQVWVAQDYWYSPDTLNFITMKGEQKMTPISSIDRATTLQLNSECGMNFQLPR